MSNAGYSRRQVCRRHDQLGAAGAVPELTIGSLRQGERLTPSGYARQPAATAPDGTLALRSETLGLELRAAPGREMRFRDPVTGVDLRSYDEEAEGRLQEAEGRRRETAARRAAEKRVAAAETRAAAAEARAAELAGAVKEPRPSPRHRAMGSAHRQRTAARRSR